MIPTLAAATLLAMPWTRMQRAALLAQAATYLQAPVLRGAHVGLLITDAQTGQALADHDGDDAFVPASDFKLLVGSVALTKLGTNFTFTTTLRADDENLYLQGGGDAHLDQADLEAAAAAVAAAGIHQVNHVVVDATRYDSQRYPPGWSIDDLPYYYAAPVSALDLDENTLQVRVAPGDVVGAPTTLDISPPTDAVQVVDAARTGAKTSADTTDIVRPWNAPTTIRVVGSYPLDAPLSESLAPAIPDPPAYAGDLFVRALAAHGVRVLADVEQAATPTNAREIWSRHSLALPQLLAQMWLPSDNLMAELFLRELGVFDAGPPGSIENGAKLERAWLRGIDIDPSTLSIADGSGLSIYDRISPRVLVAILAHDWNAPTRALVLQALPVAGERGTLREAYRATPAAGNVIAKTGTLSHVRTISGYVTTRTHGTLIFSLLVNDWVERGQHPARRLREADATLFSYLASQ